MSKEPESHLPSPPFNPALRKLIEGKRCWSSASTCDLLKRGFRCWHERGYLPHRDEPGLIQMVTFRLYDSFPVALRSEWAALLAIEDNQNRRRQLERYLDKGRGCHWLQRNDVAATVENALLHFHGSRYDLRAWVIMPNHVHVLVHVGGTSLSNIVENWKKFTAHEADKLLKRRGPVWAADYWDTFMRDSAHELRARRYIENNPVKAVLVRDLVDWPWSSARFRNRHGNLGV